MSKTFLIAFPILIFLSGCSQVTEATKTFWGSSTRALQAARAEADTQDFHCEYGPCFASVLDIAQKEEWTIFIQDAAKGHIVVMGIKGNVNTTEVGIFFSELRYDKIKVEVSSLSSTAKHKVSEIVFRELNKIYISKK